jgi:hypothetical protein
MIEFHVTIAKKSLILVFIHLLKKNDFEMIHVLYALQ